MQPRGRQTATQTPFVPSANMPNAESNEGASCVAVRSCKWLFSLLYLWQYVVLWSKCCLVLFFLPPFSLFSVFGSVSVVWGHGALEEAGTEGTQLLSPPAVSSAGFQEAAVPFSQCQIVRLCVVSRPTSLWSQPLWFSSFVSSHLEQRLLLSLTCLLDQVSSWNPPTLCPPTTTTTQLQSIRLLWTNKLLNLSQYLAPGSNTKEKTSTMMNCCLRQT